MERSTDKHRLHDTIALVTGASRGAGRGIAREFGAAGATVYDGSKCTGRVKISIRCRICGTSSTISRGTR